MDVSLTHIILRKIGEIGEVTLNSFFPSKYTRTHIARRLFGLDNYPEVAPRTVCALLSRLKRQGLVARRGAKGSSLWTLTNEGKQWFEMSSAQAAMKVPLCDGISRLVIFDIPERERRKRDVIRATLVGCNFQQLQRSVWIGHNPLPEDFIELLDALELKDYVHIFSVQKGGTLET